MTDHSGIITVYDRHPDYFSFPTMHKAFVISIVSLMVIACSQDDLPLELDKKLKAASESIKATPECEVYKRNLSSSVKNTDEFNQVFNEALKAHCINNDI